VRQVFDRRRVSRRTEDILKSAGGDKDSGFALKELSIEIGGTAVLVRTWSPEFAGLLKNRYGKFAKPAAERPGVQLEVEILPCVLSSPEERLKDLSVHQESGRWVMERGDFRAEWDADCSSGRVRQALNPYGIDGVLRIAHSLILARNFGFLAHAASAIRNGRAYLFAGVSGVGKTTISRLAPPDVTLLTDEISYVRRLPVSRSSVHVPGGATNSEETLPVVGEQTNSEKRETRNEQRETVYEAFGTPFSGELGLPGENIHAPVAAFFLLAQAPANKLEPVTKAQAVRGLLRNILFFAQDANLVRLVFQTVLDFVERVPVFRLEFVPDASVWELIA
jgi:hypothetical protein